MTGNRRIWVAASAALIVLFSAVGWVSMTLIRLDRSEQEMRRDAMIEENVRLSLWRIDSAIAPILARESLRPSEQYQTRFPVDEHVKLHFQFDSTGDFRSPQPDSQARAAFLKLLSYRQLVARLQGADRIERGIGEAVNSTLLAAADMSADEDSTIARQQRAQQTKSVNEFGRRQGTLGNYMSNSSLGNWSSTDGSREGIDIGPTALPGVEMTPVWIDDELILARRVTVDGREVTQGCWMDWPGLRASLMSTIADLLPGARISPVSLDGIDPTRTLVSLPATVHAGVVPGLGDADSPVTWTLLVVWAAVLLAAGAVIALIVGIVALSERRASFVSAVTHELRTPLTTLQTYSEMLADGKIKDPNKRTRYVKTLQREALRLGHLVENVLSFSRIEKGRDGLREELVDARSLLERMRERLAQRAGSAEMQLVVSFVSDTGVSDTGVSDTGVSDTGVSDTGEPIEFIGDASAVEQVVFNLVDNASKYAARADDRRIVVSARNAGRAVDIGVRDFGPGIAPDVRKHLFQPFSKSAERAAISAPGVGLGLALSQRLARAMGGRLRLDDSMESGTRFVLSLERAAPGD